MARVPNKHRRQFENGVETVNGIMINGIKEAMSPLLSVSRVVGLGRFEYPPGQPRLCFTLLYISVLWIIYIIGLLHYLPLFLRNIIWPDLIYLLELWLNIFIMFSTTSINLYNYQKIDGCLKRITAVDDTLEALGVSRDYSKQYKTTLRTVLIWLCFTVFAVLCYSYLTIWGTSISFFETLWTILVSHCAFHVNSIVSLSFGVILRCVSTRLDRVNERIQKSVDNKANKRGRFQERLFLSSRNPVIDEKNKRVLWTAMHLHSEICKISRELNTMFEVQISFEMVSVFLSLITLCIYFFRSAAVVREGILRGIFYVFENIVWTAICIGRLYYVNSSCDIVSSKANLTKGIIDKAIDALRNTEDRKDMMQFILQMMHKPLKFTGMGLFYFGHDFMRRLLVSVTTVVIIMLQMDVVPSIRHKVQYKQDNGTGV